MNAKLSPRARRVLRECQKLLAARDVREDLQWLVPVDARGVEGLRYIVSASIDPKTWAIEHAQDLVDAGYVRVVAQPYVRGVVVGDRRNGQRYTRGELATLKKKGAH